MTLKDDKKLKHAATMTTGVSTIDIKAGDALTLHDELVSVIIADAAEAVVQYGNGAQRLFKIHALADYRELGTFPASTRFSRPVGEGMEVAYVEHVTSDGYIIEMIDANGQESPAAVAMTYAELIAWHMAGPKNPPEIPLPTGATLYVPKAQLVAVLTDESDKTADQPVEPEALQFGQALVDDLRAKLAAANKAAEEAEINGQIRINELQRKVGELNADLLRQNDIHVTDLLAKNAQIARLEAKAAILNPAPTRKEVYTLIQMLAPKERRTESDLELAAHLNDSWTVLDLSVVADETSMRIVTLVRDLPASPAPKVVVTDAAIYSTSHVAPLPIGRPPVQMPPMPVNQTVIMSGHSRALTHNGPRPGDTKRIATVAELQQRKADNNAEIKAILDQTSDNLETLRRQAASQPNPFRVLGAQS